jgi:hypothetical protein
MTNSDIAHLRLHNQRIAVSTFERPADVVSWMGAVQAQDYLGALWAVGLRMRNAVEADIERALAERTILRTWPMRGTMHFVAAADARWMLELMTPRIVSNVARCFLRRFGLDESAFARSKELFERALQGGRRLTRTEMYKVLEEGGVSPAGQRGRHILWRLAQDGAICFGARQAKEQTFVLLDEWAPESKRMSRDESLAELAGRYFTSRGPATLQDFAWWSGLTITDASAGLEMSKRGLTRETADGQTYWLASSMQDTKDRETAAYLLPAFDEYTIAYKNRSAVLDPAHARLANTGNGTLFPTIVVDGRVVGIWKRALKKDSLTISPSHFTKLKRAEIRVIHEAASRYGKFLGAPVVSP